MSALTELPARLIMRERRGWTLELAQHTNDELIISQWELGHLGYLQPLHQKWIKALTDTLYEISFSFQGNFLFEVESFYISGFSA